MEVKTETNRAPVTKEQLQACFRATVCVAQAIREAGSIPSGNLYAVLMDKIDFETFGKLVQTLKNSGLISRECNA